MPKANSDSTARMALRSKTSMATGVTRARVKAGGQAQAACIVLKVARTVRVVSGSGRSLSVASVMMPSIPSEPQMSPVNSKPTTFLLVRPPVRMISPVGSTTSSPST